MKIILLLLLLTCSCFCRVPEIIVAWDANAPEDNVAGYRLYYGLESGNYINSIDVGNVTHYALRDLIIGVTYFSAVTAYNECGLESLFSNEISFSFSEFKNRKPIFEDFKISFENPTNISFNLVGHPTYARDYFVGEYMVVQYSNDLKNWFFLKVFKYEGNRVTIYDSNINVFNKRFYRLFSTVQ